MPELQPKNKEKGNEQNKTERKLQKAKGQTLHCNQTKSHLTRLL